MPAYKYTLKDGKTTRWYANFYFTDWTGEKNISASGALRHRGKPKSMNALSWIRRKTPAISSFRPWSRTIWRT